MRDDLLDEHNQVHDKFIEEKCKLDFEIQQISER